MFVLIFYFNVRPFLGKIVYFMFADLNAHLRPEHIYAGIASVAGLS